MSSSYAKEGVVNQGRLSFAALGVNGSLVKALQTAFPKVLEPTRVQERLIPEILGKKDILLKDGTGTGKTFGLVIGLLNKPRMVIEDERGLKRRVVTTLFVVPHRDLAYQVVDWIGRVTGALRPSPRLSSIAQVVVRGSGKGTDKIISELKETPPHILIGTPQGLMEVYKMDKSALELGTLRTVVVDEVDYLVETDERKLAKHSGLTKDLLDVIYEKRKEPREEGEREEGMPQLIMSSATLRVHFKNYLYEKSGWLNSGNVVKISGEGSGGSVTHSMVVAEDAEAMEAIATRFALDMPSLALLVIPSSAGVRRAVEELRELGVNAVALDVQKNAAETGEDPVLLVGTVGTTRGLDVKGLSHVFVVGAPGVGAYTHIAGRVGRFGEAGRVVSVVTAAESRRAARVVEALGVRIEKLY